GRYLRRKPKHHHLCAQHFARPRSHSVGDRLSTHKGRLGFAILPGRQPVARNWIRTLPTDASAACKSRRSFFRRTFILLAPIEFRRKSSKNNSPEFCDRN